MKRKNLILITIAGLLFFGCSLVDSPEIENGKVRLNFVRSQSNGDPGHAAKDADPLQLAMAVADSIVVLVYPPGSGDLPEVIKGVDILGGTDTVSMSITVIAEQNKRVAVRLYSAGSLEFFGVDEDVDVVADAETRVQIQTIQFMMSSLTVNPVRIWKDEPFVIRWPSVVGADGYQLEVSGTPDFASVFWDTLFPDTLLPAQLPDGDYYFRVAARNDYAQSDWSSTQIHVGGAPFVSGLSQYELLRGYQTTFEIYGIDLDHPSVQVSVFNQVCTILQAGPTSLQVQVTPGLRATSDYVSVSNTFTIGSAESNELLRIQSIAYVMGDLASGDGASASAYKGMIDGYSDTNASAVYIMPYTWIEFLNMAIFDVVIIGWDTGTNELTWGGGGVIGKTRADAIAASEASVLGMGVGGASYFELVGLDIGIQSCAPTVAQTGDLYVVNRPAQIFNAPNPITIPLGNTIDLYLSAPSTVRIGVTAPGNSVGRYGSGGTLSTIYPLADAPAPMSGGDTYNNFLWGLHWSPADFTSTGLELFENVVTFMFEDGTKVVIVNP